MDEEDTNLDEVTSTGDSSNQQPLTQPDREAQPVDAEQPPRLPFAVVGVGASAGGIEAFGEFLKVMPPDTGMAFVFVLHLTPDRHSMVADILGRLTKMPVEEVAEGMAVLPDHVYVIAPSHVLTIKHGHLHLGPRLDGPRAANRPVDDFFKSLAQEQRERAIAIIMSGMGSNGAAGCQAIKAVGGLCIAQDPEQAQFPSMPRHLVEAGYADFISRTEEMPEVLLHYINHPYATGEREADAQVVLQREQQHLREIMAVLRTRVKQDFSGYKKPTVLRRVQRRMGLSRIGEIGEYAKLLRQSPSEVNALADDLLIHVTGFFRDPDAWDALRERVVVPLIAGREERSSVRCWVTACSSGEEAYSLAILLVEEMERVNKHLDIKVFATDMADRTLANARNGVYPGGIEAEITPDRLMRFFEKDDAQYRVRPDLRECVVFAPQNLLQDPPFSRLDIASCRNLLIYLEPEVQQRVLGLLHFGLREGGALFLGNSETLGGSDELFEPLDKKARIFRRIGQTRHGMVDFPLPNALRLGRGNVIQAVSDATVGMERRAGFGPTFAQLTQRTLLDHHLPPAVLVDRDNRIMYFQGNTRPFLEQPSGEPTRDLMSLAREGVRGVVRVALHRAAADNATARTDEGWIETKPGHRSRLSVTASPVADKNTGDYFVVSFELRGDITTATQSPSSTSEEPTLADDMRRMRDELQSTVEELQTSNEELKASHEEVVSINEELQSSNEELETSKEEMQSLNEELATVNAQLQSKMEEHQTASNDLTSLLKSTDLAVLFLDRRFRIRKFTPAVRELLDLIAADEGRPLKDLAKKFTDPDLLSDGETVLERLMPLEREVTADDGRWFLRRITPYRTTDNRIDGIVLAFIDVTPRKVIEAALRQSEHQLEQQLADARALQQISTELVSEQDPGVLYDHMVEAMMSLMHADAATFQAVDPQTGELVLLRWRGLHRDSAKFWERMERDDGNTCTAAVTSGERIIVHDIEADAFVIDAENLQEYRRSNLRSVQSTPLVSRTGERLGMISTHWQEPHTPSDDDLARLDVVARQAADLIDRIRADTKVRASEDWLQRMVNVDSVGVITFDLATGALIDANDAFLGLTGYSREEVNSRVLSWRVLTPPEHVAESLRQLEVLNATGRIGPYEKEYIRKDGTRSWMLFAGSNLGDGTVVEYCIDISNRRGVEIALREGEERFRLLVDGARDFAMLMLDTAGRISAWNIGAERLLGFSEKEALGQQGAIIFTPEDRAAGGPETELGQAAATGRAIDERWHLRKDGSRFWGSGIMSALRTPEGAIRGFVKILRDDTGRKQAEEAEKAALEAAELANRTKDEFLATLSHELRTPLSAILLWSNMLNSKSDTTTLEEGLAAIRNSADSQRQLIEDLLDTSRITTGNLRLELKSTQMVSVVQGAIESVAPTAQAKEITLVADVAPDVGVVRVDPTRMKQVLWNLLSNAVKFTPSGGTVRIELRRLGHQAQFRVIDSGRGISPDFLPHVFEPFRQADSTTTRTHGGLGLGLAICKKLVEQHGGTITAQSDGLDRGAIFTVTFPAPVQRGYEGAAPSQSGSQILRLDGTRLLLVEDDTEMRNALTSMLRQVGAEVIPVESADTAFKAFRASPPDLMMSDIGMPGEDGYSLMRRIRAYEKKAGLTAIPAVALTAFASEQDRQAALTAGFNEHLKKPVEPIHVVTVLHTLLKRT